MSSSGIPLDSNFRYLSCQLGGLHLNGIVEYSNIPQVLGGTARNTTFITIDDAKAADAPSGIVSPAPNYLTVKVGGDSYYIPLYTTSVLKTTPNPQSVTADCRALLSGNLQISDSIIVNNIIKIGNDQNIPSTPYFKFSICPNTSSLCIKNNDDVTLLALSSTNSNKCKKIENLSLNNAKAYIKKLFPIEYTLETTDPTPTLHYGFSEKTPTIIVSDNIINSHDAIGYIETIASLVTITNSLLLRIETLERLYNNNNNNTTTDNIINNTLIDLTSRIIALEPHLATN